MMGPDCIILDRNHATYRTDVPMRCQGFTSNEKIQTVIGNDVWIGMNVTMTPGRKISDGTVVGSCCLLCKELTECTPFLARKRKGSAGIIWNSGRKCVSSPTHSLFCHLFLSVWRCGVYVIIFLYSNPMYLSAVAVAPAIQLQQLFLADYRASFVF